MHNLQYLHDKKQKNIFLVLSLTVLTLFLAIIGLALDNISNGHITVRTNPLFALPIALAIIAWISVLVMTCITSMKCIIAKPITTIAYATMLATTNSILLTNQKIFSTLNYTYTVFTILLIIFALLHLYLINKFDVNHRHRLNKDLVAFILTFILISGLITSSVLSFRMTFEFYVVFYFFFVFVIFQLLLTLHDIYYLKNRFIISPILNIIQVGIGAYLLTQARIGLNSSISYKIMFSVLVLFTLLSFVGFVYNTTELIKRHLVKIRLENSR